MLDMTIEKDFRTLSSLTLCIMGTIFVGGENGITTHLDVYRGIDSSPYEKFV